MPAVAQVPLQGSRALLHEPLVCGTGGAGQGSAPSQANRDAFPQGAGNRWSLHDSGKQKYADFELDPASLKAVFCWLRGLVEQGLSRLLLLGLI